MVEKALLEHIDLDARVTLGVLCDQTAPVDSSLDAEERAIRDKLRFVVFTFLITGALPSIRRYAKPNSPLEDLMLDSLIGVSSATFHRIVTYVSKGGSPSRVDRPEQYALPDISGAALQVCFIA